MLVACALSVFAIPGSTAMGFELKSSSFAEGGDIPKKHTCDAADVSPPLEWTAA